MNYKLYNPNNLNMLNTQIIDYNYNIFIILLIYNINSLFIFKIVYIYSLHAYINILYYFDIYLI